MDLDQQAAQDWRKKFDELTTPLDQRIEQANPQFAQQMPQPEAGGNGFNDAAFQQALAPGRDFLVNEPDFLNRPMMSEGEKQADEFKDFFRSLPLDMRADIAHSGGLPTLASHFMQQRQSEAAKLEELKAQQQQQHFDNFLKLDKDLKDNPEMWDHQMKVESARGNPYAQAAVQVGDKKLQGEFASLIPLINTYYPEFADRFTKDPKSVGRSELKAVVMNASKIKDKRALADADAQELNALERGYEAYTKNGTPMGPGDAERLLELRTAQQKKALELEKLKADIALTNKKASESGGQNKFTETMNDISVGLFDKHPSEIRPGEVITRDDQTRFKQFGLSAPALGTPRITALSAAKSLEVPALAAQNRALAPMGVPASVQTRSNLIDREAFFKHDMIKQPPEGITEGQMRKGNFVEMTDKQREEWSGIVNSGVTMSTLFDLVEPLITAKDATSALKQYGTLTIGAAAKKIPDATTYAADSEAFSSRMARVFGSEVGVLTQGDVDRWKRALPTFGDTVDVLKAKKRVFYSIFNQTKQMYKKKIAGEDFAPDLERMRKTTLNEADKLMTKDKSADQLYDILTGK